MRLTITEATCGFTAVGLFLMLIAHLIWLLDQRRRANAARRLYPCVVCGRALPADEFNDSPIGDCDKCHSGKSATQALSKSLTQYFTLYSFYPKRPYVWGWQMAAQKQDAYEDWLFFFNGNPPKSVNISSLPHRRDISNEDMQGILYSE